MGLWKNIVDSLKMPSTLKLEEDMQKMHAELEELRKAKVAAEEVAKAKTPKEIATSRGEPYVNVVGVEVDKANPRFGNFELDWNTYFIDQLKAAGYVGDPDESIIEQWFEDVCRHVVLESYEQEQASIAESPNVVRYIDRRPTGDGKTIVS